jgi:hypothetical protein
MLKFNSRVIRLSGLEVRQTYFRLRDIHSDLKQDVDSIALRWPTAKLNSQEVLLLDLF